VHCTRVVVPFGNSECIHYLVTCIYSCNVMTQFWILIANSYDSSHRNFTLYQRLVTILWTLHHLEFVLLHITLLNTKLSFSQHLTTRSGRVGSGRVGLTCQRMLGWVDQSWVISLDPLVYNYIHLCLTVHCLPFPQIDIIGAMVIVWRVRRKIIRSVLCNTVCNNCAQCNAHTYEQT